MLYHEIYDQCQWVASNFDGEKRWSLLVDWFALPHPQGKDLVYLGVEAMQKHSKQQWLWNSRVSLFVSIVSYKQDKILTHATGCEAKQKLPMRAFKASFIFALSVMKESVSWKSTWKWFNIKEMLISVHGFISILVKLAFIEVTVDYETFTTNLKHETLKYRRSNLMSFPRETIKTGYFAKLFSVVARLSSNVNGEKQCRFTVAVAVVRTNILILFWNIKLEY